MLLQTCFVPRRESFGELEAGVALSGVERLVGE